MHNSLISVQLCQTHFLSPPANTALTPCVQFILLPRNTWTFRPILTQSTAEAGTMVLRGRSFIQISEAANGSTLARRIGQFPERENVARTGLKSRTIPANRAV